MFVLSLRRIDDPEGPAYAIARSENLQALIEWTQARVSPQVRVVAPTADNPRTAFKVTLIKELAEYSPIDSSKEDEGIHEINRDILLTRRIREFTILETARIDSTIESIINDTLLVN